MDRSTSPTTVINTQEVNTDMFRDAASRAFLKLKQKLQKNTINAGDALLEFHNYSNHNNEELTELFCLTYFLLDRNKDRLNDVEPTTHEKLVHHLMETYSQKLY